MCRTYNTVPFKNENLYVEHELNGEKKVGPNMPTRTGKKLIIRSSAVSPT
jgi:hypothetical protein